MPLRFLYNTHSQASYPIAISSRPRSTLQAHSTFSPGPLQYGENRGTRVEVEQNKAKKQMNAMMEMI